MYTFPRQLKITALSLIVLGFLGMAYGFLAAPSTVEEAQAMVATAHHEGEAHGDTTAHAMPANDHAEGTQAHHDTEEHASNDHGEHLLHQLQNKPWAAVYVAALFFMMIALGTLAFGLLQYSFRISHTI